MLEQELFNLLKGTADAAFATTPVGLMTASRSPRTQCSVCCFRYGPTLTNAGGGMNGTAPVLQMILVDPINMPNQHSRAKRVFEIIVFEYPEY